ncbi:hypothetical protein R5R35_013753 [Gryllus longicercus]|uniref:Pacifastin domain-containing protein n=1 Tax=Gryllus longicercus TaxID=2509291 RepID=A0AAN9ZAC9_9ORTH
MAMALGVRARVCVGVGAVLVLSAALAGAWPAPSTEAAASSECVSGHRKANLKAGCGGSCYCLGGQWVCPEGDCGDGAGEEQEGERDAEAAPEPFSLPLRRSKRVPLDGERCAPGVTYMDECNTCICSMDGIKAHASCTFKVCPK